MPELNDHDRIVQMHAVLLGTNGNKGLCEKHEDLAKDYYKFKRYLLVGVAFLVGSGLLGISTFELIKRLAG